MIRLTKNYIMKKAAYIFTVVLFFSCSPKWLPLKGSYPATPIEISSDKGFDEVWDKLVDVFAQNGLSIKIIDRSSGLIISYSAQLLTTIEKKDGSLADPNAWIAVPQIYSQSAQRYVPITKIAAGPYVSKSYLDKSDPVSGEWNVRIKKTATGTTINVNLVNLTYSIIDQKIPRTTPLIEYKSTGVFEKLITDILLK